MTTEEKINLLEEVLDVEEGTLTLETALEDIKEYDSMAKLSVIVTIEDEFGKKISADVLRSCQTVKDIVDIME